MKKADLIKCPRCKGKGWDPEGAMTLYYSSGRMRLLQNKDSLDPDTMSKYSTYKIPGRMSTIRLTGKSLEQQKYDESDYLRRKVLSTCTFCNGKKKVNKEALLMMVLRGEVKLG